jgi:hypothetical protein
LLFNVGIEGAVSAGLPALALFGECTFHPQPHGGASNRGKKHDFTWKFFKFWLHPDLLRFIAA